MTFLDNSGDIILDAVLTETGRQRMAQGNFKITKFALGDDEINYALYNVGHPSGSGYRDLEILQTPIFEATTQVGLNSSLISLADNNLLYVPELILNEKLPTAVKRKNNTIYIPVNSQTKTLLDDDSLGWGTGYTVQAGQRAPGKMITIESCMNSTDIDMTRTNQNVYLTSKNMLDTAVSIIFNSNFIAYPLAAAANTTFANNSDGSWGGAQTATLQTLTNTSVADRQGFNSARGNMSRSGIFTRTGAEVATSTLVDSLGVVGSMTYLNIAVDPALTTTKDQTASTKWTKFGQTGIKVAGINTSYTFSIITLCLDLTANNSGAQLNIPITLIKRDTQTFGENECQLRLTKHLILIQM